MKAAMHASAGVLGFVLISAMWISTILSALLGSPQTVASTGGAVFYGMFVLLPLLAAAGATGVSLLGKRTGALATVKQKRGPRAFMTGLFILLPTAYFLKGRAADGTLDGLFFAVQGLAWAAGAFAAVNIGLNIRDGLRLSGRIGGGSATTPIIEALDGGPLLGKALVVLNDADGSPLEAKATTALCRCGASKRKPYCDGSHNKIGFDSSPSTDATKDEVLTYEGQEITIHYNRLLCSHAAECGKRSKAAFDSSRKPWIVVDNASVDEMKAIVQACPSGALRFSTNGAPPQHAMPGAKGVTLERNGPYRVVGVPLAEPRLATGANPQKYVLCRCGASKNKPFCDGSHYDVGWTDANPA